MPNNPAPKILTPEQEMKRRTRRGFLALGAGAATAAAGWEWLNSDTAEGDIPPKLRRVLGFNERVARKALFSDQHLAKTYPKSAIGFLKKNGDDGMDDDFDPDDWALEVTPHGAKVPVELDLDAIRSLPKHEQIIDFKCVEGWSVVTWFAGVRFSDFTAKFAPGSDKAGYVSMVTPGDGYYVGLDAPSAMHPQTLLAYEMNGEALTSDHGAPLRLVIPVKYGIKNIKRIGKIAYGETQPPDYWQERGYDFYAGL
jgi:DMSO/TMAO reductase YedYZ molybdopterin-dependent catalytic subunit